MPCSLDSLKFPELHWFPSAKRSLKVEKVSVDPPVLIIAYSNVMNATTICKLTIGFRLTLETNLSSSSLKPTQLDDVHCKSTLSKDLFKHESTTVEYDA